MNSYDETVQDIITAVGGKDNIEEVFLLCS